MKVVRCLTDQKPGDFTVEYQVADGPVRTAIPSRVSLEFPAIKTKKKEDGKDKKEKDDDDDIEEKRTPKTTKPRRKPCRRSPRRTKAAPVTRRPI
ncbi:MAG TPA: hypothetical protein VFE62_26965 [Gemmataceae bacterium]|nr:hypothetical protein [Gemmataceae bacterium]